MKILIAPDSFKGTLSAAEVCSCIEKGLRQAEKSSEIISLPLSDGGEGFAEILSSYCNAEILYTYCSDIYGRRKKCSYFTFGKTAVIECAQASGLQKKKDVMNASSYGTGELIKAAYNKGCSNIILGLGGSGCCDGGAGALTALGAVFRNIYGEIFDFPTGKDLENIYGAGFTKCVKVLDFTFACDVTNLYYGKNGAAYVFAPQKGANANDVEILDRGLKMLGAFLPKDISRLAGAGAAGGLCGGLYGVYGGKIKSGFDIIAESCNLEEKIKQADLVITGEGKTDSQTLMGKLPFKISELCKKHGTKCVLISGVIEKGISLCSKQISLADNIISQEEAIKNAAEILTDKSKYILQ